MLKYFSTLLALVFISTAWAKSPLDLTKTDRDELKKETIYAIDLIQRYHYKQKKFSEIDSEDLLMRFMEDLDSTKYFFTQEDRDLLLKRFGPTLKPTYLYVGDLYPAFEIFEVYYNRVTERMEWIDQRLQQPFNFDTDMTHRLDRSESDWPANKEEADLQWEKRILNDLIVERLDGEPLERALETVGNRYDRLVEFLDDIEVHNIQETFLTSLAQLYDPHSNFFSWDSAKEFDIQISNALVGIGAQLRDVDGYVVIERLLPGGPAEMSGRLHPGDKIVAVAQGDEEPVDVVGMKLRKVVQQIRGKEGSAVRLTVLPSGAAQRKVVNLVRERIELTANLASAELYELPLNPEDPESPTTKVGVINLPSFYGEGSFEEDSISTSGDISELIAKLKEHDVESLILDFRRNGGGRLDEAVKLTGLFIPTGPVVMKRSFNGDVDPEWDRMPNMEWDGPLVVLVSRASASASEIVAGALQVHNRAVIVGDQATHGKGTVQAPVDLRTAMRRMPFSNPPEVGTIKITVQQFYLPDGASTQNRGVVSDIPIPSANMFLLDGEEDLDNALEWNAITGMDFTLSPEDFPTYSLVSEPLLETLKGHSSERMNSLPEFAFLREQIDWSRQRHDQKDFSLNLKQRMAEKEKDEATREIFEDTRKQLAAELLMEPIPVELALTDLKEQAHQEKLASTPLPNGQSRVNAFYQKVFYYQPDPAEPIKEIWVEFFDYQKALDALAETTQILTQSTGISLSEIEVEDILTRLKNRDPFASFSMVEPFQAVLGDRFDEQAILKAMPAFFTYMAKVDPDVLRDKPELDVHLREAVRIARDWVQLKDSLLDKEATLAKTGAITEREPVIPN